MGKHHGSWIQFDPTPFGRRLSVSPFRKDKHELFVQFGGGGCLDVEDGNWPGHGMDDSYAATCDFRLKNRLSISGAVTVTTFAEQ